MGVCIQKDKPDKNTYQVNTYQVIINTNHINFL